MYSIDSVKGEKSLKLDYFSKTDSHKLCVIFSAFYSAIF